MLLHQVLLLTATLLFCFLAGEVSGQNETTTAVPQPPRGFFRKIIFNLKHMFQENKKKNEISKEDISDKLNETMSILSADINVTATKIKEIIAQFGNLSSLNDPKKDMIGKVLSLGATGASVFADSLSMGNTIITILNDGYQSFNSISDKLYDLLKRNYDNYEAMAGYPPSEVLKKIIEIYNTVTAVLTQIKNVIVATMNEIEIILLQAVVKTTDRVLPVERTIVQIKNSIVAALKAILEKIYQLQHAIETTIKNMRNHTKSAIDNTVKKKNEDFKKVVVGLAGIADELSKKVKKRPGAEDSSVGTDNTAEAVGTTAANSAAGGSATTAATTT